MGSAIEISTHEYQLTQYVGNLYGEIWDQNRISLLQPFSFDFQINLGSDAAGADGVAFVLQTDPRGTAATGHTGYELGAGGILPNVTVEFDTFPNAAEMTDPPFDHIMVDENANAGNFFQYGSPCPSSIIYSATGVCPVQASPSQANIKDGAYHPVRITWDPGTKIMEIYFDNNLRMRYQKDIAALLGDTCAFLGFTASTGGSKNDQRIKLWQCITSPTITPTFSLSPTYSRTPTMTPSNTPIATRTITPLPSATPTFTSTLSFTFSPTAVATNTPLPTATATPLPFMLHPYPNSPNPFGGSGREGTWFTYYVSRPCQVVIEIYSVSGELARKLDPVQVPLGTHEQFWDAKNSAGKALASGVFVYRIVATDDAGETSAKFDKCAVMR